MFEGKDYWKNYMVNWFGEELIEKWDELVTEDYIQSNERKLHLEVYDSGNSKAPTIIFSHGIAGYARVMLPFTMPLREAGYNVVVPDLQGYGYNEGLKGNFNWNLHVKNLIDTVKYAGENFNGKIVLSGGSMGSALAYAASCRCDEVDALVCWCLWDLSDNEYIANETTTKKFTYLLIPFFKLGSKLFGSLRLKTYRLISYDTLSDSQKLNELVKDDPQAGTHITLEGAASLILESKPPVKHEDFELPILVFQPGADEMTPKYYTKKVYEKLGSETKEYIELVGAAHFPTQKKYYSKWAEETDKFLKKNLKF